MLFIYIKIKTCNVLVTKNVLVNWYAANIYISNAYLTERT